MRHITTSTPKHSFTIPEPMMATLKARLKTASKEFRTPPLFHHTRSLRLSREPHTLLQYTPAISIHDPEAPAKLFRYLTNPSKSLSLDTVDHYPVYAISAQHILPCFQTVRNAVAIMSAHAASSGNTTFAVVHPLPGARLDRSMLPYTVFPVLSIPNPCSSGLTPLAVAHCFLALRTAGLILPPGAPEPSFVNGCIIQDAHNYRFVRGKGDTPANAIRALVQAVNDNTLNDLLSCSEAESELFVLRKWAFSHPVHRASLKLSRVSTTIEEQVHSAYVFDDSHPVVDILTTLSRSFPVSTKSLQSKPMVRMTKPRERWDSLSFLLALSSGKTLRSLATQSSILCHKLSMKSQTYLLTCLNGCERAFHVCRWGDTPECLPIVVEIEIIEEGDGSRSVVGMRLVDEIGVRMGFKALTCAPVGSIVCRRGCCGLVEGLGVFVYGIPGDQLAVADCSNWFEGLI